MYLQQKLFTDVVIDFENIYVIIVKKLKKNIHTYNAHIVFRLHNFNLISLIHIAVKINFRHCLKI